jgi:ComF family protein
LQYLTEIFDFFLPRFCFSCNRKLLSYEEVVCPECLSKIKLADLARLQQEFNRKFLEKKIISGFTSLYVFEKDKELQHIIHPLKYNQRFLIGKFLGKKLGNSIMSTLNEWLIDFIVPVPLHQLKKAERGYNQSFYIAKGISEITGLPINDKVIKRKRFTQSQTTMNMKERQANISNAFKINNKNKLLGKNFLIVDDVITTGATTSECGKVLLKTGANKIYAASVAIAD